jgi:prolyl 4-hydroxylase
LGFEKIKTPEHVWNLLQDFWERNKDKHEVEWEHFNTFHNMWDSPPTIADVQKEGTLRRDIWDSAKDVLEEWTGKYLAHCSIWGVRSYHNGSILTPHVDRNPLVSSAIINVAQDVNEP